MEGACEYNILYLKDCGCHSMTTTVLDLKKPHHQDQWLIGFGDAAFWDATRPGGKIT